MTGTADDGREDGSWCIVTSEAGLAHAGAIVHNKSSHILVTHDGACECVVDVLLACLTDSELMT